ncbi:uncharacterized protein DS421_20g691400 [Arachis hypogaea]|nr:uncharacterized protein DS421_20g691400 [Arachis hypogaea]
MPALAAMISMGTLSQAPMAPALIQEVLSVSSPKKAVVECTIAYLKHFAYIEYSKPKEAIAALALNNINVGGRPLNVEMAKSLSQKSSVVNSSLALSSLPLMMQEAVAMQQMQFQQALLMQQTMTAQQAANKAATMKSTTELAATRAAEISLLLLHLQYLYQSQDLLLVIKEGGGLLPTLLLAIIGVVSPDHQLGPIIIQAMKGIEGPIETSENTIIEAEEGI